MQADTHHNLLTETLKFKIKSMLEHCKVKEQSLQKLPQAFFQFLYERGLDKHQLTIQIPRYVRVKPKCQIATPQLAQKLGISIEEIVQIENHFWAINPSAKINHCQLYQAGILYGMDYSSSFPVKCLQIEPENRILQLCCAPGNKSMLIADLHPHVHITGVEINCNRANIMKNLVNKYKLQQQIDIVVADGLNYNPPEQFDRVLVDAECTHEGSLKHIHKFFKEETKFELKVQKKLTKQQQKQFKLNNSNPYTSEIKTSNKWSKQDFQQRFLDTYKLSQLNKLQYGLLQNGFKLLKENGIIVYSTCSFDYQQNEQIIENFLKQNKNAELMIAPDHLDSPIGWKEGTLKGTIRLTPSVSYCGGMFVAKLLKKPTP